MVEYSQLTPAQIAVIERPARGSVFLAGAAGTGKTTTAVERLLYLIRQGVPASEIAVLLPQPTLAQPYHDALRRADLPPGGQVEVTTISAIAREMVALYFPEFAERAGFKSVSQPPTFISLETAQYVMARIVSPLIEYDGYFDSVTIDRARLYSQIIDNLNKAAVVGFGHTNIAARLKAAWVGEASQLRVYDEVQDAGLRFRQYCLDHNLIDFSLTIELFIKYALPLCRDLLFKRHPHVIADNIEEDNPVGHAVLKLWLSASTSALIVQDDDAGFRRFLGADPESAETLRPLCNTTVSLDESLVTEPAVDALASHFSGALDQFAWNVQADAREALRFEPLRFYPQMIEWVAEEIAKLIADGTPPGEIVVLAPFLSDALRFSLMNRLESRGIKSRSHRPSRALREEPAARTLITLAQLAHPDWKLAPNPYDVAYALMSSIRAVDDNLDLVRAQMLTDNAYPADTPSRLAPFDALPADVQERITFVVGERYDALRDWIEEYIAAQTTEASRPARGRGKTKEAATPEPLAPEIDHFFSLIFGEVLSRRGFGFDGDIQAADVTGNLIDSARGFRQTIESTTIPTDLSLGQDYVQMVLDGVIANQYIRQWERADEDSVFIAPAYTFLLSNRPVNVQFWLDIGSRGWFERLYQPLTHPYVLSNSWNQNVWTDVEEIESRRDTLYRLLIGLLRRCRQRVYLGVSQLGENGSESNGELLITVSKLLRRLYAEDAAS